MSNTKETNTALTTRFSRYIDRHPLGALFGLFLLLYLLSFTLIYLQGVVQPTPWRAFYHYLLMIASYSIPVFVVIELEKLRHQSLLTSRILLIVLSLASGLAFLVLFQSWQLWVVPCILLSFLKRKLQPLAEELRTIGFGMLILVLGYGINWNLNYFLALNISDRLVDPLLWKIDLNIYSFFFGTKVSFEGIFPLLKDKGIFALLEAAYFAVLPEVVLVLTLKARQGKKGTQAFLVRLFSGYAIAAIWCFLFPSVGPCFVQSSMDVAYQGSLTYSLMQGEVYEFNAVQHGLPLGGVAYFIALPSMHVAVAALLQILLRPTPILFWAFLPVNILSIASTVILGYHYILDVPTGFMVTAFVFLPDWLASMRAARNKGLVIFRNSSLSSQTRTKC